MDKKKVVTLLQRALAMEQASALRYLAQAAVLNGPIALAVAEKFRASAEESTTHAGKLRTRIAALGATPTIEVERTEEPFPPDLAGMIDWNLREEEKAVKLYRELLRAVPHDSETLLNETVEHILTDEMEGVEELRQLKG